jgi:hypothetical protein
MVVASLAVLAVPVPSVQAQIDAAFEAELRRLYDDDAQFEQLSGAARSLLERKFGRKSGPASGPPPAPTSGSEPSGTPLAPATVFVNNPAADATAQDTQSETAVIAIGSTVVTAFNDSGSCLPGCGTTTLKFTGYARSTDGGATFTDLGALPTTTGGDSGVPVLAKNPATGTLYLATLRFTGSGIQCWRSTDNGVTWPLVVNCAPGTTGFQDKPWIAVEPGLADGNVYVAWRDFGVNALRFARSTDSGATWGPSPGLALWPGGQGANVVVGSDAVYVFSWQGGSPQTIQMRKSTDKGVTFASAVTVAADLNTTGVNGDLGLAGGIRTNSFPQAAATFDAIYVVYSRIFSGQDTDVFIRRSTDGGATWGDLLQPGFSSDTEWSPSIAVDSFERRIMVSFYRKPAGAVAGNIIHRQGRFLTIFNDAFTLVSTQFNITTAPFPIVLGQDPVMIATYMGDYDQSFGDFDFFYQTWGDNLGASSAHARQPDVRFSKYYVIALQGTMRAAVLPLSRSVQVGGAPATAFAVILNTGSGVAVGCRPAPPASPPANLGPFTYQTTTAANVLTGAANTPANIAPAAMQNFVFGFAPTGPIAETSLAMQFLCGNAVDAPQNPGVNNFFIVADTVPVPDTIALMSTVSADGVVRIPSSTGVQLFAIGTSNVGATGMIVVSGDVGLSGLPVTLTVCETTGGSTCLAPPTPSVTVNYAAGTNRSFAFFAQASASVPFDPANSRVFARLRQAGPNGVLRGATSAAVCTMPNPAC